MNNIKYNFVTFPLYASVSLPSNGNRERTYALIVLNTPSWKINR